MEQPNYGASGRTHRRDVSSLESIARDARKCKVIGSRVATVFPAHDMIELVGETGVFVVDEAVFASASGAPAL